MLCEDCWLEQEKLTNRRLFGGSLMNKSKYLLLWLLEIASQQQCGNSYLMQDKVSTSVSICGQPSCRLQWTDLYHYIE